MAWIVSGGRTVDEEDQDALLHRVVGVGDVALQLEGELRILAADFNQLPGGHGYQKYTFTLTFRGFC